MIMITAHSGCEGLPDNSMAAVERGIALGADCVEVDVRADSAGKLWLTHDLPESFDGLVALQEVFEAVRKAKIAVNCDLKAYTALLPTLRLAEKCGIEREQLIFSGSVDTKQLRGDPEIVRRARIFLNAEELARDLAPAGSQDPMAQPAFFLANAALVAERFHQLGAEALNASYQRMSPELIDTLRAGDVGLSLWTINDVEALQSALTRDLVNITTRNVSAALAARDAIEKGSA